MGIEERIIYIVVCDNCGAILPTQDQTISKSGVRIAALNKGWKLFVDQDYPHLIYIACCPTCKSKAQTICC